MFHCPVGDWVIEQHAIILSATVRSCENGRYFSVVTFQSISGGHFTNISNYIYYIKFGIELLIHS